MAADPNKKLVHIQMSKAIFDEVVNLAARHHSTIPGAVLFILEEWLRGNKYIQGVDRRAEIKRLKDSVDKFPLEVRDRQSRKNG